MSKYALVIIDMQWNFPSSRDARLQTNIIRQIRLAKKKNYPIICLEYIGDGRTIPKIRKELEDYKNKFFFRKNWDDGSDKILSIKNKLPSKFRVCGVNTDACVFETVVNLSDELCCKIEVLSKSCNSLTKNRHYEGLEMLKNIKNVVLI